MEYCLSHNFLTLLNHIVYQILIQLMMHMLDLNSYKLVILTILAIQLMGMYILLLFLLILITDYIFLIFQLILKEF